MYSELCVNTTSDIMSKYTDIEYLKKNSDFVKIQSRQGVGWKSLVIHNPDKINTIPALLTSTFIQHKHLISHGHAVGYCCKF